MNKMTVSFLILAMGTLPCFALPPMGFNAQRGMTNFLGPETWSRCAAQMVSDGVRAYELSYERSGTMPKSPFAGDYEPKFLPSVGNPGTIQIYNMETLNEGVADGNQGTQMDALGHFGYVDKPLNAQGDLAGAKVNYFGGLNDQEVKPTPKSPLLRLGIETVPPIVTTAVMLDLRKYIFAGKAMGAGEFVTVEHIEKALQASGIRERGILVGDVVLINTGWSDHYQDPDTTGIYYSSAPGLSYTAAEYLGARKVVAVGLDTPFVDALAAPDADLVPAPPEGTPDHMAFPVHHYFLTQAGIHTFENFKLNDLVENGIELSCIVVLPLLAKGSAASPVRPIAFGRKKR